MSFLSPPKHRNPKVLNSNSAAEGGKGRALLEFPNPRAKSKTPGGIPDATGKLESAAWLSNGRKPTKLLMNVNLQSSLEPVQVVMPQEDSVGDLIKAVVDIYTREKRRPLLTSSDHRIYELHYSQFCLEGEVYNWASLKLCHCHALFLFICMNALFLLHYLEYGSDYGV